jgi:hypothetical protein
MAVVASADDYGPHVLHGAGFRIDDREKRGSPGSVSAVASCAGQGLSAVR